MTIEEYLKDNPDFDIYLENELEFSNPNSSKEAEENLRYILDNEPDLQALAIVVKSYYGGVIQWERF